MKKEMRKFNSEDRKNVKQEEIQDILFNREMGWKDIIYDLINTEQLDPWDVDIVILTNKYLEKIRYIETTDFFISSKVLLAASLLLRIKSDILLNKQIKSIDEILFGQKEKKEVKLEKIEIDEDDIPILIPKSPMSRLKKVTLKELMESLNKAIKTENRRIQKEILNKNAIRETSFSLPKKKRINIKNKISEIYKKLVIHFKVNSGHKKISFTDLIGTDREERIISFSSLLHLENQRKIWLEQQKHFREIYIWLKHIFLEHNPEPFSDLKQEIENKAEEIDNEKNKRLEKINKDFQNPIGD